MNNLEAGGEAESVRSFFEEAHLVELEMISIREILVLIKAANNKIKPASKQELTRTGNHISEVRKIAQRIQERLEFMDRSNSANRGLLGCGEGTTIDRLRTSVPNDLRKTLQELMIDYKGQEQKFLKDYGRLVRHFITPTEEDVAEKMKREEVLKKKYARKKGKLGALLARIKNHTSDVKKTSRSIFERLQSMDRSKSANREGTTIDWLRTSVTKGHREKFKELMMDFRGLRQRIRAERGYFKATREEVLKKDQITETLSGIKNRYDAAKEVENSLLELHQVLLDMAVIVEEQGEKMDVVEFELNSYQRSSREWFWLDIILLIIIVLQVVITIADILRKA